MFLFDIPTTICTRRYFCGMCARIAGTWYPCCLLTVNAPDIWRVNQKRWPGPGKDRWARHGMAREKVIANCEHIYVVSIEGPLLHRRLEIAERAVWTSNTVRVWLNIWTRLIRKALRIPTLGRLIEWLNRDRRLYKTDCILGFRCFRLCPVHLLRGLYCETASTSP